MEAFCYCHKSGRTLSCRDNFYSVNSNSAFVRTDPQFVLRNTWTEKLQSSSYRQLQPVLCEVPCIELILVSIKNLSSNDFCLKMSLKYLTFLKIWLLFHSVEQQHKKQKQKIVKNKISSGCWKKNQNKCVQNSKG